MISNCGHDENGKYHGGRAGDQNGKEWAVISWYNRPWNVILRHPDKKVQENLAYLARSAAENENIGYDQYQRTTYWTQLQKAGYDPSKISVKCEADCSSGVAANVKAAGYRLGMTDLQSVSKDCYTGNLRSALKKAGFQELTESKYLSSDKYLLPGDILLYEGHHTATNLDKGSAINDDDYSSGWHLDSNGWWYAYGTHIGEYYRNEWKVINHHWYYFGDDGYMLHGWQMIDGQWFYLEDSGDYQGACWHEVDKRNGALERWKIE